MKSKYLFLLLAALFFVYRPVTAQVVPAHIPQNGLLGWWPFNTLADESGAGRDAHGGTGVQAVDRKGNNSAYYFNNTYTYIEDLPFNSAGNWSVAFWMKLMEYKSYMVVMDLNQDMVCNGSPQIWQQYDKVSLSDCNSGKNNTPMGSSSELLNEWYHFVIVNTGNSAAIYRNGELFSTGSYQWPVTSFIDVTIANHYNTLNPTRDRPSKVYFDDLAFWNRDLTTCEISLIYNESRKSDITQQPQSQFAAPGDNVMFYVVDSGTTFSSFQWQADIGTGFQNLSNAGPFRGVNTDTLTVLNVTGMNSNQHFRCIVSRSSGCSDTSDEAVLTIAPAGIGSLPSNPDLMLFPNPAKDFITLKIPAMWVGCGFIITDLLGITQLRGTLEDEASRIVVAGLPGGSYLLRVEHKDAMSPAIFLKN